MNCSEISGCSLHKLWLCALFCSSIKLCRIQQMNTLCWTEHISQPHWNHLRSTYNNKWLHAVCPFLPQCYYRQQQRHSVSRHVHTCLVSIVLHSGTPQIYLIILINISCFKSKTIHVKIHNNIRSNGEFTCEKKKKRKKKKRSIH
jgi:hypothetical protein